MDSNNRCSCESSHCRHCKEFHKSVPGACTNPAEYKVEMFGMRTRLCTPCLESAKDWSLQPDRLTWSQIRDSSEDHEELIEVSDDEAVLNGSQIDLNPKHGVSIELSKDGRVLWVNVDGICRLRASNSPRIEVRVAGERPIVLDTRAKADAASR